MFFMKKNCHLIEILVIHATKLNNSSIFTLTGVQGNALYYFMYHVFKSPSIY